ncbi:MAG: phosphatidate cytidylyltransferase [Bdellovibrionales bacterium]
MNEKLKAASLKTRVISAAVAVTLLALVGWRFEAFGLEVLVGLTIALMVREYLRLSLLPLQISRPLLIWFLLCALGLFAAVLVSQEPLLMTSVCIAAFLTVSLWLTRNRMPNDKLLTALSLGVLGFFLCVVFPTYEIHTLRLPNGMAWFVLHLLIVFAGDVFAYFGGILWGKEKLMPQISPKKTVAGSFAGLVGSVVIGVIFAAIALKHTRSWQVALFALVCGFVAQMGDLLISLIKRVADVKDSGSIMPGHGGVLDRIDGVIVTCPLIYAFALAAETWL